MPLQENLLKMQKQKEEFYQQNAGMQQESSEFSGKEVENHRSHRHKRQNKQRLSFKFCSRRSGTYMRHDNNCVL